MRALTKAGAGVCLLACLAGVVVLVLVARNRVPGQGCDTIYAFKDLEWHWALKRSARWIHALLVLGMMMVLPQSALLLANRLRAWSVFSVVFLAAAGSIGALVAFLVLAIHGLLGPVGPHRCLEPLPWFGHYLLRSAGVTALLLGLFGLFTVAGGGLLSLSMRLRERLS